MLRKTTLRLTEGLSVIVGLKTFHQYLWGHKFTIVTDHKPLLGLFGETKAVPQMLSPWMQRWALTLAAYEYQISHRPGQSIRQADALSRLPVGGAPRHVPVSADTILTMQYLDMSHVTASDIRRETSRDPLLSQVFIGTRDGFPDHDDNELLKPYTQRRDELSSHDGCLMWGTRVIIPSAHRQALLEELHNAHSGIVRMKAVGRSLMWWPGIDQDIEKTAKTCDICMRSRPKPTEAPLQPWSFPDRPWSRLHIDYAGPFMGRMMLVVTDAHSKWIDAHHTSDSISAITISKLRQSFSTHGIPDVIVSDNATGFVSEEFQEFCRHNGIKHITSAPHHPASNGLAERAVGIVNEGVKRMHGCDLETKLARFLFDCRITPHSTTGIAPAELLMHRQLKARLHLIRPDVGVKVVVEQTKQTAKHDRHAKVRTFQPGELVYALRYHGNTASWVPGTIHLQTGPVSYTVRLEDGTIARHHSDQLQGRLSSHQVMPSVRPTPLETFPGDVTEFGEKSEADQQAQLRSPAKPPAASQQTDIVPAAASVAEPRRSEFIRKHPERLDL